MVRELSPEDVLHSLEKGKLPPFYLFFGPGEFRLEKVLERIRASYIPESARDFNLEVFYGDRHGDPTEIINHARSAPFLADNRLLIIRRTEQFNGDQLEQFLPYLKKPSDSTCLIFIVSKPDFRKKFYHTIKALGMAVNFRELRDREVVPWIRKNAADIGLRIDHQACLYLQQVVGNRLRDLNAELEKLLLSYGEGEITVKKVKELVVHSRIYTIFELMNAISSKDCVRSLDILNRFLQEEGRRDAPLGIIGMMNRQIRLLLKVKEVMGKGGDRRDVAKMLGAARFAMDEFIDHSRHWTEPELEKGLDLLYKADGHLKSSSRPRPVLESLILSLCS
jgi:DNA polymerase-3 subunit delta